ncbi:MAG: DUF1289 domain-containing protein [Sphingomonas sp.]|nr:DUF1289 domain-containing protein [Sphingomonas sp.]
MAAIASPCVNTCRIDPVSRHCIGCGRTIDEIARWGSETPQWRAAVMAALPTRRGDHA